MTAKKKVSIKEQIRRNRQAGGQPTKTVTVWLGADMDVVAEYEAALQELENPPKTKKLGEDPAAETKARVAALRAQLEEYRVAWRVRGLDDKRWERLVAQHPPRKTDDGSIDPRDRAGWNSESFPPALVKAATVSPDLDDEDWAALLGDDETEGQLTASQLDGLAAVAATLTKQPIDVPFWPAASPTTASSASE